MKAGITGTATPVRGVILEEVSIYFTAPLVYLIYKMNTISEHYRNSCVNQWSMPIHYQYSEYTLAHQNDRRK